MIVFLTFVTLLTLAWGVDSAARRARRRRVERNWRAQSAALRRATWQIKCPERPELNVEIRDHR